MTNEQKLQHYQEMLELVKKYLDINYEYLTLFGFEVELEKFVEKIDDLSYRVYVLEDQQDQVDELEDQVSDLKNEIKDLKKKLKNKQYMTIEKKEPKMGNSKN